MFLRQSNYLFSEELKCPEDRLILASQIIPDPCLALVMSAYCLVKHQYINHVI